MVKVPVAQSLVRTTYIVYLYPLLTCVIDTMVLVTEVPMLDPMTIGMARLEARRREKKKLYLRTHVASPSWP